MSSALAASHRIALRRVSNRPARELRGLLVALGGQSPDVVRDTLMDVVPVLGDRYASSAGLLATDYYDQAREVAGRPGSFRAEPAANPVRSRYDALVRWGVDPLFGPAPDMALVLVNIAGGLQRVIADVDRETVVANAIRDPQAAGWQRIARTDGCQFCRMLADRGAVYTESTAVFASHDNCFPGGVLVTGPSVEIGYRRWYEGELVVIGLAGGEELPVTPNHPVLTPHGWVTAGLLREGDDVIERTGADLASLQVPHEHDVPTPIEDVWGAAGMDALRSVPVAAQDFHGDAGRREGYVDVVAPHGLLSDMLDADIAKHGAEPVCPWTGPSPVLDSFATQCDRLLPVVSSLFASDGGMRGGGQLATLGGAHSRHSDSGGFGRITHGQFDVSQPAGHHAAGHAVPSGHGQHALAGLVDLLQVGWSGDAVMSRPPRLRPRYYAAPLEGESDAIGTLAAQAGRDLVERLSGGVQLRRVVEFSRRDFAGHVYNFQTAEGWFAANSVVVSNCNCSAAPAWDRTREASVLQYTASKRNVSQADRDRVRDYLNANYARLD